MEYEKANLKEYTKKIEYITEIFASKIGISVDNIFFFAVIDEENKLTCYRDVDNNVRTVVDSSLDYFKKNPQSNIYKKNDYFVTDRIPCFKYLEGDFIIALHFKIDWTNCKNKILNEYYEKQIENYLVYILPLIYHNVNTYPEFLLESQIYAVTKTMIENQIKSNKLKGIKIRRIYMAHFFTIIEKLSTMTYEGEFLNGKCLIFLKEEQKYDIKIKNTIPLDEIKKIRKLLEITCQYSDESCLGLVCNIETMTITGLIFDINIKGNYTKVIFNSKDKWKIYFVNGEVINELDIVNSKVCTPTEEQFEKKFKNIFRDIYKNGNDVRALDLIKHAQTQKHGTMIVFSDHAEQECIRLNNIGYRICCNNSIDLKFIEQITSIDGSIFVSPSGVILGMGIVLDGESCDECEIDNSRGSRYNSAIKYTYSRSVEGEICIAIVISEDKDINIIVNGKQK